MYRSTTTKDIGLLWQLFRDDQLKPRPEFQRASVWPKAAKAYLIDTILNNRPMPIFFMKRTTSLQTGRPVYEVIDGQQRLRAMFEFLDNELALSESKRDSKVSKYYNFRYQQLPKELQQQILNYTITVEELSGYSDADIRDTFVRMNKYVVKLSPQELRHAKESGKFADFAERLGGWSFWEDNRVFSDAQMRRMRSVEFAAELSVLLLEGPQDKKRVIDLYYHTFRDVFPEGPTVEAKLKRYIQWITDALPEFPQTRYRKPVDLYALIGALEKVTRGGEKLGDLDSHDAGDRLLDFEAKTLDKARGEAARYLLAASRQTDNIGPRNERINILSTVLVK